MAIYQTTIITAFLAGIVSFLFWKIERKIDKLEADNEAHHKEQVKVRMAERELLLAMADTTILTAKKVNDKNSVNGDLEEAIKELQACKDLVQKITREIAIEQTA